MTKKMIILNASPRKNRNTATLLKEVQRGAEAAGSEVEYIPQFGIRNIRTA